MISEKYQKQLELEKRNKGIIEKIITENAAEDFINFYRVHTQKETLEAYNIPNLKILRKILEKFNYDFSIPKQSKFKGKKAVRSHESYVNGGKKSSETQKESWKNKSQDEVDEWKQKMKDSHSSKAFKEKISQINIDYWNNLTEEEKRLIRDKKSKYTNLSIELEQEIIKYYLQPNSLNDTAHYFNLHTRIINKILKKYNINKHSKEITNQLEINKKCKIKDKQKEKEIVDFYLSPQSLLETAKHFNLATRSVQRILKKYNIREHSSDIYNEIRINKSKLTLLNLYGMYHPPVWHFKYQDQYFDSFPELCIYMYYVENNIAIIREPIELSFEFENKTYHYYPDFKINDEIIEIKGDHFLTKNNKWCCPFDRSLDTLYEAKRQCALQNNVKILYSKDYQKYIDWFNNQGYKKEDFKLK